MLLLVVCRLLPTNNHLIPIENLLLFILSRWDVVCLCILQDLYYTDEYTLLDGDKQASVQPQFGVKQGCPLLFSFYLNDVRSLAEGVQQGALTGIPYFTVPELLFADDHLLFLDLPRDVIHSVAAVICVKLMMMSRMNSMLICTAHTPIQYLFKGDISPHSQRQEHRMFLLFCTNKLHLFYMN